MGGLLKIFKKGSKAASGMKKKDGGAPSKWPSGIRIGVVGHANSGKSVYFTCLNEDCKISKRLQISVSDTSTAGLFLANYRSIWGIGTTSDIGTHVDVRGEKKFPEPSHGRKVLQFNAIVDRTTKVPIVTLDYDGKAVAITQQSDIKDELADFFSSADGLLFFYDSKMLGSEPMTQEHVAAFINVLESLAPLNRRLPIPVALVVTKADILPGFSGDDQVVLVSPEDESILSQDFELFLERVLNSSKMDNNPTWAGTVRDVLVRTSEFLKVIVGRTLNFQIFFVSSTGQQPTKIGTDVGRSIYAPPEKINPIGIKEPFHWMLSAVVKNRKYRTMGKISKWAAILCLIWVSIFSLPYLYHFSYLLPGVTGEEDAVLQAQRERAGTTAGLSNEQVNKITRPYRSYTNNWMVKQFFKPFRQAADQILIKYGEIRDVDIAKVLDNRFANFQNIIVDSTRWPIPKVGDSIFVDDDNSDRFNRLSMQVDSLYVSEDDFVQTQRRERLVWFMDKFRQAILEPDSTAAIWDQIQQQIAQVEARPDVRLTNSEKALFESMKVYKQKQTTVIEAQQTGSDIEQFLVTINDNNDPAFRLITAPDKLRSALGPLQNDPANAGVVEKINDYLSQVKQFENRRNYVYKVAALPDGYHAHVMVRRGKSDTPWRNGKQLWPGLNVDTLKWSIGDQIVVAVDGPTDGETWGRNSKYKKEIKNRLALFDLQGTVDIGAGVTVSFTLFDNLEELLPKVK